MTEIERDLPGVGPWEGEWPVGDHFDPDLLRDGDEPPEPPTDGPARASGRPQLKRVK